VECPVADHWPGDNFKKFGIFWKEGHPFEQNIDMFLILDAMVLGII
jgi:hypothetical protein